MQEKYRRLSEARERRLPHPPGDYEAPLVPQNETKPLSLPPISRTDFGYPLNHEARSPLYQQTDMSSSGGVNSAPHIDGDRIFEPVNDSAQGLPQNNETEVKRSLAARYIAGAVSLVIATACFVGLGIFLHVERTGHL